MDMSVHVNPAMNQLMMIKMLAKVGDQVLYSNPNLDPTKFWQEFSVRLTMVRV